MMIPARRLSLALVALLATWIILLKIDLERWRSENVEINEIPFPQAEKVKFHGVGPAVPHTESMKNNGVRPTARIAIVCCEKRSNETLVLLKSALLFSQDANLEVFIFADNTCGPVVAKGVEQLKFQTRNWRSMFEVHFIPYRVPVGTEHWKVPSFWMCSTNRLFMHEALPEADAVLYLDTDHVILGNMTDIWEYFVEQQRQNPYAVMTLADHVPPPARYNYDLRDIPFFGNGGINSGTIFMNLTRMREFQFGRLAFEMYEKYDGKFAGGPDQDIINIVFGTHRDNATIMECNFSLHPEHCGGEKHYCSHHTVEDGPVCFCWPALWDGVYMIHAYAQTFHGGGFLKSLWDAFERVRLDSRDVLDTIQVLKEDFPKLLYQPVCFALTPQALYRNAEMYLMKILLELQ